MEVEELESLLRPDDSDVDFRRILEEARDKKGCAISEIFSSDGPSEFLVVSRTRWDEHQRKMCVQKEELRVSERQWQTDLDEQRDGWSHLERRVIVALEDHLKKCINIKGGDCGLGALDGARRSRGLPEVHLGGVCAAYVGAKLVFFRQAGLEEQRVAWSSL